MPKSQSINEKCKQCDARKLALFAPCSEKELEKRRYQPHHQTFLNDSEILFSEGDININACTLQSGWALCFKLLPDGHRQILHIAMKGDFLGYRSDPKQPIDYSVISVGSSTFCSFSDEQLKQIFSKNFDLTTRFFSMQDSNIKEYRQKLTVAGQSKAKYKIAHFFCDIIKKLEDRHISTTEAIDFPLTREDIADAIGITSVHLSRISTQLTKDNVLSCRHGKLIILDRDKLFQMLIE